jgi:hypothetical protein
MVRQPRTALVKQDQPKGTSETLVEIPPQRILPAVDQVRAPLRHEDKVGVSVASIWYAIATPLLRAYLISDRTIVADTTGLSPTADHGATASNPGARLALFRMSPEG